jgi:3-hydroxybutyrate dehydrogenase
VHNLPEGEVLSKVLLEESAIKRLDEPDEVTAAVAYLCSDDATFITGTNLVIDGGWTAH